MRTLSLIVLSLIILGCGESQTIEISPTTVMIKGKNLTTQELITLNAQALLAFSNEQLLRAQQQEIQRTQIEHHFYLGLLACLILCLSLLLGSSVYFLRKK